MITDVETIRAKLSRVAWYHAFEIVPGVVTPGVQPFDAAERLNALGIPLDLSGQRALDIGAWDGPMAFELERRGAAVVAVDVLAPEQTGFNTAKEILGSHVEFVRGSVIDLSRIVSGEFDVVSYMGVFYHLKDPITAFQQIAAVLKDGGQVLFEGECLRNYAETVDGEPVRGELLTRIADSEIPLAMCAPGDYKQLPNWFIPNLACLRSWTRSARLEIVRHFMVEAPQAQPYPRQRIHGVAVKLTESVVVSRIRQVGRTITVDGGVFTKRTVINFFNFQNGELVNLGGLDVSGKPRIPLDFVKSTRLSFLLPPNANPGTSYLEALNPPFTQPADAQGEFRGHEFELTEIGQEPPEPQNHSGQ